jgi:hypothetical protein
MRPFARPRSVALLLWLFLVALLGGSLAAATASGQGYCYPDGQNNFGHYTQGWCIPTACGGDSCELDICEGTCGFGWLEYCIANGMCFAYPGCFEMDC